MPMSKSIEGPKALMCNIYLESSSSNNNVANLEYSKIAGKNERQKGKGSVTFLGH